MYILNKPSNVIAEENPSPQEAAQVDIPVMPIVPVHPTLLTTTTVAPIEKEIPEYRKNCFHAEPELCQFNEGEKPFNRDINTCQCRSHPTVENSWFCCNITHMSMISTCSNISIWTNLHILNISVAELDFSNSIYQTLHSLAITDGNIKSAIKSFSRFSPIKCLNISNNNLPDIPPRALSSVPNLKFLDISRNNLTILPNFNQNTNITVDMK